MDTKDSPDPVDKHLWDLYQTWENINCQCGILSSNKKKLAIKPLKKYKGT
jgi:hypothetical protein